jgi:hypothetical protein
MRAVADVEAAAGRGFLVLLGSEVFGFLLSCFDVDASADRASAFGLAFATLAISMPPSFLGPACFLPSLPALCRNVAPPSDMRSTFNNPQQQTPDVKEMIGQVENGRENDF